MNQVTLPVKHVEEAAKFYRKMGFVQIVETEHYARFSCPDGDSTFSLQLETEDFISRAVIYFEHKELDKLVEGLLGKGFVFEQLPEDMRYLWREAILKDPSGNKIKLYWAGENRLNPPWRIEQQD